MSTVQSVLDLLQYRPDIQVESDDLVHIFNAAIRAVSKRLYALDSSLIVGELEVKIFAEQSYAASIAFVDSNPDTLTDAANQFVVEGFAADMPIKTDHASNPGPFRLATVAVGTLTLTATDSVVAAIAGAITVTSDDGYGYLPSDFWGLRDKFEPYLSGKTYPLKPLPTQSTRLEYTGPGDPVYYKIRGTRIYVTPETATDYTIKADYYQKPTEVTLSTSTIPFNELFDDVIADYVETYFRGPLTKTANLINILDKLIKDGVDAVANKHDRKGATPFPSGIQWGF